MNGLPGLRFIPIRFTPTYSTFKDQACSGIQVLVTQRDQLQSVDLGIGIAQTLQRLYPTNFALQKVNHLLQDLETIDAIKSGKPLPEIKKYWGTDLESFKKRRSQYLLYPMP